MLRVVYVSNVCVRQLAVGGTGTPPDSSIVSRAGVDEAGARLSGTASLLRGFSYVVAGDGNPPMRFHLCAIETTLVTTRVAVGEDACGSGPVGPSQ